MEAVSTGSSLGPPFVKGAGCWLYDANGTAYFDGTAGSGAILLGHQHTGIREAAIRQLDALVHTGCKLQSSARAELMRQLVEISPYPRGAALPAVIGTEAVEAALKIARAYTGRRTIVGFRHAFHGKSTGALSLTWRAEFKKYSAIDPDAALIAELPVGPGGPAREPSAAIDSLDQLLRRAVVENRAPAAIIVEPVQVTEGVYEVGETFLEEMIRTAHQHGALVIFDEIYTGIGRCGSLFYSDRLATKPDLTLVGKSLGNGFPISAVLGDRDVMNALPAAIQTSTYSGHPVSSAAASEVLRVVCKTRLWEEAERRGRQIVTELQALEQRFGFLRGARHCGALAAIDCTRDGAPAPELARRFGELALSRRLLLFTGGASGATIKIVSPVIMEDRDVDFLVSTLAAVSEELSQGERSHVLR